MPVDTLQSRRRRRPRTALRRRSLVASQPQACSAALISQSHEWQAPRYGNRVPFSLKSPRLWPALPAVLWHWPFPLVDGLTSGVTQPSPPTQALLVGLRSYPLRYDHSNQSKVNK